MYYANFIGLVSHLQLMTSLRLSASGGLTACGGSTADSRGVCFARVSFEDGGFDRGVPAIQIADCFDMRRN